MLKSLKVGRCDLVNSDDQMANSLATHLGHEVNQRSAAGAKSKVYKLTLALGWGKV